MVGWTQFTARFEDESQAEFVSKDFEMADENGSLEITYNETLGPIARVRIFGYQNFNNAMRFFKETETPETALVANFNDTSDAGEIIAYRQSGNDNLHRELTEYSEEAMRWDASLEFDGLVETGIRAGQDFDLEDKYDE